MFWIKDGCFSMKNLNLWKLSYLSLWIAETLWTDRKKSTAASLFLGRDNLNSQLKIRLLIAYLGSVLLIVGKL